MCKQKAMFFGLLRTFIHDIYATGVLDVAAVALINVWDGAN